MSFGRPYILQLNGCIHDGWLRLKYDKNKLTEGYFYYILSSSPVFDQFSRLATGGVVNNLNKDLVSSVQIPLPSIEIQNQIVEELDSYQKIIDGCKQVIENYKPSIDIDPNWKMVELAEICEVRDGTHDSPKYVNDGYPLITSKNVIDGSISFAKVNYISQKDLIKDIWSS
jgi:type I restriction enzyme M protein